VSQLPPRFPGGPQLRIERLPKFEGESDSSEELWDEEQPGGGASGGSLAALKDHARRVHQLPPRVPGGPQLRLDKGADNSSSSNDDDDEGFSGQDFAADPMVGVSGGRRSSSHSNVGSFGRRGSQESEVPLGGRASSHSGASVSSRGSGESQPSRRKQAHAVKVLPPAYAGGPRLRVDVAKSDHSSDESRESAESDDSDAAWAGSGGGSGSVSRSASGDGWGGAMAAYQTPATAAAASSSSSSSSSSALPPAREVATLRVEPPEFAHFRSSLQAMVARQPQVAEARSGARPGHAEEDDIPMSNTVVTGSGLRFELSDFARSAAAAAGGGFSLRSRSVIESVLDDDFLDSLMDAPTAAAAGGVASTSVATFLFDSGLGAHMGLFEALGSVRSVDDLYRVGDFSRLGLPAADGRTLRQALAQRARAEAFRAADDAPPKPPTPQPTRPPPAAAAAASTAAALARSGLSAPQRAESVIASALDDDFLDSLMDDGPPAVTSAGPAAAVRPPRSVIASALSDDFLDSLLADTPSPASAPTATSAAAAGSASQRSSSVIASALDDDFLDSLMDDEPAAPPPLDGIPLPAFLRQHGLAQYREGLADLGVGSVTELFEVAAGELVRAPVRMSQADVRTLQAALATKLMRDD
jgi:hypothetical protein